MLLFGCGEYGPQANREVSVVMGGMKEVVATANANVALAKYWGKRDDVLNLPYTGSLSVTLAGLTTTVRASFLGRLSEDRILLTGHEAAGVEAHRFRAFLDLIRQTAGIDARAEVAASSNFPVAAGLASSASTFAALAVAATHAAGVSLSAAELSVLARRGSGSAARSIHGGYVEWLAGEASDGTDSLAVQVAPPDHWPIGIVVAVTDEGRKRIGSREGMAHVAKHSPFFPAWLESHDADLEAVRTGIQARDLARVGAAAEHNCLKMHAVCLAAQPAVLYWTPATVAVMQRVVELRHEGLDAYFTIDAGPQVKVLCLPHQRAAVAAEIGRIPGVRRVLLSEPGAGAQLTEAA
jgi:diphosphomevalonate decarboxylase